MRVLYYCQALAPNPLDPNPKPRGLGLTLKCCRPPHIDSGSTTQTLAPPTQLLSMNTQTTQHSKSKNILEWSPLLVQRNKFQVNSEREDRWQSTMFKENIININLLIAPLSKCQHPGQTYSVQDGPRQGHGGTVPHQSLVCKEYLNHPLGLTLSNPGLVRL